jgi:hypothetical protein
MLIWKNEACFSERLNKMSLLNRMTRHFRLPRRSLQLANTAGTPCGNADRPTDHPPREFPGIKQFLSNNFTHYFTLTSEGLILNSWLRRRNWKALEVASRQAVMFLSGKKLLQMRVIVAKSGIEVLVTMFTKAACFIIRPTEFSCFPHTL